MSRNLTRIALLAAALAFAVAASAAAAGSVFPTAPQPPALNPFVASALSSGDQFAVDGRVLERVRAGSYLYLRIDAAGQQHWAATLASLAPDGNDVHLTVVGRSPHFHSARLNREFEDLWFAAVNTTVVPPAVHGDAR